MLKNLSRTSITIVAETCEQPLPQVMSPKSLRQIQEVLWKTTQFYDVQREFGEQDQQAPIIEEVKEFGQIETQSLLDHEMAEMSPVEKMAHLQSQMHFDESVESIADSELEGGELQKLLTSPQYAQKSFWETRCNGRSGEGQVSAQTSHSSEGRRAPGKPAALLSPRRDEQRNLMWSSVFGNADVSNLSRTLLEGNKDHLRNQARSVLAKRELHVE